MTTYSIRCRNSRCRHRRVSKTHPDDYKIVPKCAACGERRGWRIESRKYNKQKLCNCDGPKVQQSKRGGAPTKRSTFPHKTTHPECDHHPSGPYNQAKRAGVSDDDIPFEYLGRKMKPDEPCPF